LPYIPAVDGLRALAVIAVILYHANFGLQGGFLGVEVFFIISGYLITSLLLAEWGLTGKVDLKGFWLRRARRLLPAVYLLLVVVLAYSVLFLPEEVASLRSDAAASAAYVTNWYLIFSHKSYFEAVGRPSLLRHLWSLAVEEQFYLLWPLLFFAAMSWLRKPRYVLAAVLAGIAVSTGLMIGLYRPELDPSRVYYGTDTRAAGLLVGVALAYVWTPGQAHTRAGPRLLDVIGLVAIVGLFLSCLLIQEFQPFLYRGGFLLVALMTAALIAVSVHPRARWVPWLLSTPPLHWVGLRSYGIYLWHWPVLMVTRPQQDLPLEGWPLFAVRLIATLVLADLSYRFVEMPIRRGALGRAWHNYRQATGEQRRRLSTVWAASTAGLLVFFILLGQQVVSAQPPPPPPYLAVKSINTLATDPQAPGVQQPAESARPSLPANSNPPPDGANLVTVGPVTSTLPGLVASHIPAPSTPVTWTFGLLVARLAPAPLAPLATRLGALPAGNLLPINPPVEEAMRPRRGAGLPATATVTETQVAQLPVTATPTGVVTATVTATPAPAPARGPAPWGPDHVSMIGDSVMLGAAQYGTLQGTLVDVDIDAAQSRHVSDAVQILQARQAAGRLGPIVVVHMGTNGTFTAEEFDQIMAVLANTRRAIFLNVKLPCLPGRCWEESNNQIIEEGVKRYPNDVLVDWHAAGVNHPEYFWPADLIHLRPEGAQAYADLIAAAVKASAAPQPQPSQQPQK
jgi:peptidoglycan/LPS O-acetylase OafA/YrhL